jgi:hypothetical protein
MPSNHAPRRMPYQCDLRLGPQESVAASTRVLREAISGGHLRDAVSKYSAKVPHFLVELGGLGVRVAISGEEERMAALNADILVMAVALHQALIRVMAKEARERMTDPRRCVRPKVFRSTATGAARCFPGCGEDVVVDVVTPYGAGGPRNPARALANPQCRSRMRLQLTVRSCHEPSSSLRLATIRLIV